MWGGGGGEGWRGGVKSGGGGVERKGGGGGGECWRRKGDRHQQKRSPASSELNLPRTCLGRRGEGERFSCSCMDLLGDGAVGVDRWGREEGRKGRGDRYHIKGSPREGVPAFSEY